MCVSQKDIINKLFFSHLLARYFSTLPHTCRTKRTQRTAKMADSAAFLDEPAPLVLRRKHQSPITEKCN